jgi:hypothetical protein
MLPLDTTLDAARVQCHVLRRLGHEGRLRMFHSVCDSQLGLMETGIRHRHPDYDDRQVRLARIRLMLGREQFRLAYPDAGEVEP